MTENRKATVKGEQVRTVLIEGAYGEANLGDDALMVACSNLIRDIVPGCRLALGLRRNAEYVKHLVQDAVVLNSSNYYDAFDADIKILGGGTHFFSFRYSKNWLINVCNRIRRQSPSSLLRRVAALIGGRRSASRRKEGPNVIALGIGIGPFESGKEARAKSRLLQCDFVAVRDAISLRYCREIGVTARLGADLCYLTEYWSAEDSVSTDDKQRQGVRIGVVVRDWNHNKGGNDYLNGLHEAVKGLRRRGIRVEYILFSETGDPFCKRFLEARGESPITWNPSRDRFDEFITRLAKYDLIVSARYHGLVLPATRNVPGIAINVEPKLEVLSRTLEGGVGLWGGEFDPLELEKLAMDIVSSSAVVRERLAAVVQVQRSNACRMRDELEGHIRRYAKVL